VIRLALQTLALSIVVTVSQPSNRVEVLSSTSGLPVHVMGQFLKPATCQEAANGERFAVANAPDGRERVQIFNLDGTLIGSFTLPGRAVP
jgi:hypothetical protein